MRGILETAAMSSFNGAKHARTRFVRWTARAAKCDAPSPRACNEQAASAAKRLASLPCSTTFAPTFSPVALPS